MTKTPSPSAPGRGAEALYAPQATARLSTVIASVPGIAEQSLRALLQSLPSVQIVGTAAGCLSALQLVRGGQADLVVLDSNLPFKDIEVLLQKLDQDGLKIQSLVLASTDGQVRHALAAGADAALRRDASSRQLGAVLERLRHTSRLAVEQDGDI